MLAVNMHECHKHFQVLGGKRNGFFVECGAADGVTFSNSLFFETQRSWTGLLVEANPEFFQKMNKVNRKAYSTNSCLSTEKNTQQVTFRPVGLIGGIDNKIDPAHAKWVKKMPNHNRTITAQCFTLYSLLLAVGRTEVDYFSLDVEGPELDILLTIPFDKMNIKVISVEYRVYGDNAKVNDRETLQKLSAIRNFFQKSKIYKELGILPKNKKETNGLDLIFVRI